MEILGEKASVVPSRSTRPKTNFKRLLGDWGPVVLLTLGSLWLIQGALARTAWHGVFVQGQTYDAGTVNVGAVVTHKIRLINLSTQPVTVDAQPGCGCTSVDLPAKPIPPISGGVVDVAIDTDDMDKGIQERHLMLKMQDGGLTWQQSATIRFRIR